MINSSSRLALLAALAVSAEGTGALGDNRSHSKKDQQQQQAQRMLQRSVLLEKAELLSHHFPEEDAGSKEFVILSNSFEEKQKDHHHYHYSYNPFANDSEKQDHAKRIVSQKRMAAAAANNNDNDNDNHHKNNNRNLIMGGHIADILLGGCNAEEVYDQTSYDDGYKPVCTCFEEAGTGQFFMECELGDDTCSSLLKDNVCSGTHEVFFFSDSDGDLTSKATCTVCKSENCEGVSEICTSVGFDDDFIPAVCRVVILAQDAQTDNTTNVTIPATETQACLDCQICGDGSPNNPYGVEHSCFDRPTNGACDTNTFAHLHNFLPGTVGTAPVPGVFSQTCTASPNIDRALYTYVNYDQGYSTLCDCDDPTSGSITCDLHDASCFANLCTDISEVFFFDRTSGEYEAKWTIDWESSLWTQTTFDPNTGSATGCSVLDNDPNTGALVQCTQCAICNSAQEGAGITFDCFGKQQFSCDTSDGRAKYNFYVEEDDGTNTNVNIPDRGNNIPQSSSPDAKDSTLPLVLGALFLGMATAFIIVLVVRQRTPSPTASNDNNNHGGGDDMTVGSSVAPPTVAGEGPLDQGDLQFTIDGGGGGGGDDENPASLDDEPVANAPGIMA